MRCQISPRYSTMKYGDPEKRIVIDFGNEGGLLYHLASTLLFWQSETDSCRAVNMIPPQNGPSNLRGSLSLLWPVFQSICLSQFIESLSCAVEGRTVMTETGMSIFEHSLAFFESEAMVNSQLGLRAYELPKAGATHKGDSYNGIFDLMSLTNDAFHLHRSNTPPEVLLMCLISCLNNLSSQVLGVLGWQARYRLINTGVWGVCLMGSFVWGIASFSIEPGLEVGIVRFPTVCIVGFIPHLLILVGIFVCACIYFFAFLLSVLSPPSDLPPARTWRGRFRQAQENLQANIHISQINHNMQEDFYTALLRIGFTALTAASEAAYLNEGRRVAIMHRTWLEEERLDEIEGSRARLQATSDTIAQHLTIGDIDPIASGVTLDEEKDSSVAVGARGWRSGYDRERTTKVLKGGPNNGNLRYGRMGSDGVGALQRGSRYILAWDFLTGVFWLVTSWVALGTVKVLHKVGIRRRPAWMRRFIGKSDTTKRVKQNVKTNAKSTLNFWLLSDEGVLSLPQTDNVDVEVETKKRQRIVSDTWGEQEEQRLDKTLYDWWSHGGWWGERDESGDYQTLDRDEDTTSIASISTDHSEADWESDTNNEGRRTPTQEEPYPRSRDSSPVFDLSLDTLELARLLNPQDAEQRQEARILAHHLSSDRIITRSQYRTFHGLDNAHVLTSTRYRPAGFKPASATGRLTSFEESELLEHLILNRRRRSGCYAAAAGVSSDGVVDDADAVSSWRDGAEGLGATGPQCVVCQSSPRTILAWPCRCLSLCEDCRVSLAMNNFGTCVCCRQEVVGFSRLFVP